MIKQEKFERFASEDSKIVLFCPPSTSLGELHDFLMQAKGNVVDTMIAVHKQELEAAEKQKQIDSMEPEVLNQG